MRQAFWFVTMLVLAGAIAFGSKYFPGTAQFIVAGTQVTLSIYVFAIVLVLLFVILLIVWRIYRSMVGLPSFWRAKSAQKREYRAIAAVQTATIALHEGRFAHADKAAKIAAKLPQSAGVAALIGAASAQAQARTDVANDWLAKLDGHDDFQDAKALQQADMALKKNDASAALVALDGVSNTVRKHSSRYRELQVAANAAGGHWHEVLQAAKDPKWSAAPEVKNIWFGKAVVGLCADDAASVSYLRSLYKDMPTAASADDAVLTTYARAMIKRGESADARRAIESALRLSWRPALLSLYAQASTDDSVTAQLKMFDLWETEHNNDADLLGAAGQLCLKAKLWGRAKMNFSNSLKIMPSVHAHYGLAQTHRGMNELTAAQEQERKAAELAVSP